MMFDWVEFLKKNHIDYVTRGPNVAAGNINIRCPMCGPKDPSHHMGIALDGSGWSCWRDPQHRGRSPIYLVARLIHVSVIRAREIVGFGRDIPSDLVSKVTGILSDGSGTDAKNYMIPMPKEFKPLKDVSTARIFVDYLVERGYRRSRIFSFTKRFGLRYCNLGPFKGRIVFPVYFEGELVSWTARTVYKKKELIRYKTLSANPDKASALGYSPAKGAITDYLLWFDDLMLSDCKTLLLVEGPFDALRIRYLGEKKGITSTCFFTSAPTSRQIDMLREVVGRYDNVYLVLDRGMLSNLFRVSETMSFLKVQHLQLPDGYDDPGELDRKGLMRLLDKRG